MGRILIVDDEDMILDLLQRILDYLKRPADFAKTGDEAVSLMKKQPREYDLAIVDLNIHDSNGIGLIKQLKKIRPQLKILLTSGDFDEWENKTSSQDKKIVNAILAKPFTIDNLRDKLKQIEQD